MASDRNPAVRSVAHNIRYDHRVSHERAQGFESHFPNPCTDADLRDGFKTYFESRIRTRVVPEYELSRVNGGNFVRGGGTIAKLAPSFQMARVLDLSGLSRVYQWGIRNAPPAARLPPGIVVNSKQIHVDAYFNGWLRSILRRRDPLADAFVRWTFLMLNMYVKVQPFQPVWVTAWAAFARFLRAGPNRWAETLGVDKGGGRWLIVLRYSADTAGVVARPTQLDGGPDAYSHFPSPPSAPLYRGGHPADLRPRGGYPREILPEYVHSQVEILAQHWEAAGRLCAETRPSLRKPIGRVRELHWARLKRRYGPPVAKWMPSPL
jgi:hypothetical protein